MVDDITDRITYHNPDCLLYKIDLQMAFHHLKLDPRDINKMGLQFEGHMALSVCRDKCPSIQHDGIHSFKP